MKKRIPALIIAVLLTISAFGCNKTDRVLVDDGNGVKQNDFTKKPDDYIVKDGKSDYVIVHSNNADGEIVTAASELKYFFKEATGIELPLLQDNQSDGKRKKIISLGATSAAMLSLGSTGEELGVSDFRIAFVEESVYVTGGSGSGVLWGTYKLLNEFFGYKFYKEGIYALDRGVGNLNMRSGDKTYKAAIPLRADYSGMNLYGSTISSLRLGLMTDDKMSVGGRHNSLELLDTASYADKHSGWYSSSGDQLCYTAHGNAAELNSMIEEASDKLTDLFLASGAENKTYARFQMMDNKNWCSCDACKEKKEEYGAQSGAMLETCNRIGEAVTRKLAARGDERKIKIVPLLYNETEDVPVVTDPKTGEYGRSDKLGKLEYVTPLWACMARKKHRKAWADKENAAALDMLERMNAAFEEFWVWDYGSNYNNYLIPFDIFGNIAEDFKLLKNYKIGLYLYQLANSAKNVTGFNSLKTYLLSEFMFNPDRDVDELTDDYFRNVYGAGAAAMRRYYDEYRTLSAYNDADKDGMPAWDQSIYSQTMVQEEYWPRGTVYAWLGYIDEALEKTGNDGEIDGTVPADNSPEMIERNVMTDAVFAKYVYAAIYLKDDYSENLSFKLKLYNDVRKLNFHHVREEGSGMENLFPLANELGITKYI